MNVVDGLRSHPGRADALLAAALFVLAQVEVWLTPAAAGQRVPTAAAAGLMTAALIARRARPLLSALSVTGAVVGLAVVTGLPNVAFLLPVSLVAMYSLGAYAATERSVVGLAVALTALPLGAARTDDPTVTDLTAPVVLFAAAWTGGRVIRGRRRRDVELEDRHRALLGEQSRRQRAAAADERRRIARELHDIVAHRVTTMVIQAESGRVTADDPDHSRRAFATIARSGRESLEELRRLLGLLHDDDQAPDTRPQPGAARLDELLGDVREAGLTVESCVEGDLRDLPAGVDLTVYRIIQEALTNALRHASTTASVRVVREGDRVLVEVHNPLRVGVAAVPGPGRGLDGMRERVRVFGGRVTAGSVGTEWVVRAELPVGEDDR